MNSRNRIWLLVVVVVGLGVVALGYLLGIAPKFEEIKAADAARAEAESTNALYERQLAKLKKDFEGIDEVQELLDELEVQLPAETEYDTYLALVDGLAVLSGVRSTGFAWSTPLIVSTDSAADIAELAAGVSTPGDSAEAPVTPEDPTGIAPDGSLVALPWAITVRGSYESLRVFMFNLQRTDRLFAVLGYTLALPPDDGSGAEFVLTVTGATYVLMNSKAVAEAKEEAEKAKEEAEAAPEEPESTPTPTSSPTPTSTPKP